MFSRTRYLETGIWLEICKFCSPILISISSFLYSSPCLRFSFNAILFLVSTTRLLCPSSSIFISYNGTPLSVSSTSTASCIYYYISIFIFSLLEISLYPCSEISFHELVTSLHMTDCNLFMKMMFDNIHL